MKIRWLSVTKWLAVAVCVSAVLVALAFYKHWLPEVQRLAGFPADGTPAAKEHAGDSHAGHSHAEDDHAGHDHGDEPYDHEHDEATALRLSKQAKAAMGRDRERVTLRPFARKISVPATVVQRPGRSRVKVTAPFTGLVTRIYRVEGEAVEPEMPLFDMQLTHEELVDAQADFLRIAEELDVVKREVARVSKVAAGGAIAGKTLLQAQYEQQKLEAALLAQRQRLLLHRLTPEQVQGILDDRKLLQHLTVKVPASPESAVATTQRPLQVQDLKVEKGQHVVAGAPLCVLADHAKLHIEGKAFEQDIPAVAAAAKEVWPVAAVFVAPDNRRTVVPNLRILYLANEVSLQSRAFSFFVTLENELVRDTRTGAGQRFVDWKYKPGQRLRLKVPVEPAARRIVLPIESIVDDGAETYVYEYHGDHFDRRTVRVEYRDQDEAVIADDGSLKPGVEVAVSGAFQIHLGSKSKGSDAVDPHAGHTH